MAEENGILKVYRSGKLTVIGFGGDVVLGDVSIAQCRDEFSTLIRDHGCNTLAIDLTGMKLIPSGLLGLLASLRQVGVDVLVFNPCEDIRDVLEITKLDQVIQIHEVDVR